MMYVTAIVLSAGKGSRFGYGIPKPLALIANKPVLAYSLLRLNSHPLIKEIILVVSHKNKAAMTRVLQKYKIVKLTKIVIGGKERQDSLGNALSALPLNTDIVVVHDGARPFIDQHLTSKLIREADKNGAAVLGVPVKDTIKEICSPQPKDQSAGIIKATLKRDKLWAVQTPQAFKKNIILEAYRRFGKVKVTDDSSLAEMMGIKVRVVSSSYSNIKITTRDDLALAEVIAKRDCR